MGECQGGKKWQKQPTKGCYWILLSLIHKTRPSGKFSFCSLSTAVVELVGKPGGQKGTKTAQTCRPKARYGPRYPCPVHPFFRLSSET